MSLSAPGEIYTKYNGNKCVNYKIELYNNILTFIGIDAHVRTIEDSK